MGELSRVAQSPFDDEELADVIISASDNVDFYLPSVILKLASPFFNGMFSLPQPQTRAGNVYSRQLRELERIPITEDSHTFDALMRLNYPIQPTTLQDVFEVGRVLEAAIKYDMAEATRLMNTALQEFLDAQPLQVYVVACQLRLEEEAVSAAEAWCRQYTVLMESHQIFSFTIAGGSYIPEMSTITAGDYHRLLQYRHTGKRFTFPRRFTPASKCGSTGTFGTIDLFSVPGVESDAVLRSSDGVRFSVHSLALRLASAENLLRGDYRREKETLEYPVALDSQTLQPLLEFCYPRMRHIVFDLPRIKAVIRAALRYDMAEVVASARRHMMTMLDAHAMAIYFMASANSWEEEALQAARHAVAKGVVSSTYVPEMEDASASSYHRLLNLQHEYISEIRQALEVNAPWGNLDSMPDDDVLRNADSRVLSLLLHDAVSGYSTDTCGLCCTWKSSNAPCSVCFKDDAKTVRARSRAVDAALRDGVSRLHFTQE